MRSHYKALILYITISITVGHDIDKDLSAGRIDIDWEGGMYWSYWNISNFNCIWISISEILCWEMEIICISCRVIRMTDGKFVWFCMVGVMPVAQAVHISVLLNGCWLLDIPHFLIEDKSLFQINMYTKDNTENCNGMLTVDLLCTTHVYGTIISTPGTYLCCITRRSLCCVRGHALTEFIATNMSLVWGRKCLLYLDYSPTN
jgi:hypothetical protein